MSKDKPKRNQITFAETKQTEGLIEKIDKLCKRDNRKRNDWIGIKLSEIVNHEQG